MPSNTHRAAASVTAVDITIHASFLPHNDPDASPAFYREAIAEGAQRKQPTAKQTSVTLRR
jgi:hypothetical protein